MVYDPIRDIELPSPAAAEPSSWAAQSTSAARYTPSAGNDDFVVANGSSHTPSFDQSPSGGTRLSIRSGQGGLRGLLNDDVSPSEGFSTRTSERTRSSISSAQEEEGYHPRPSISSLLNESSAPLVKSTSNSSLAHDSSPSNPSPGPRHHYLDPNGFLAPTTPASAYARSRSDSSRSPFPSQHNPSPKVNTAHLPYSEYHPSPHGAHYDTLTESSTRRASGGPRHPMMPPTDLPYHPDLGHLPLRSPSVSVSPRSQHLPLAQPITSRPSSSRSTASHPFSFQPPSFPQNTSPSTSVRRLSEDQSIRPRSSSYQQRTSQPPGFSPQYAPTRTPSPIRASLYDPRRVSRPTSVLRPIHPDEATFFRSHGLANNPLRKRKAKLAPSWSAPSPGIRNQSQQPSEYDVSYFPNHGEMSDSRRSQSHVSRRGSASSSVGRPSDDRLETPHLSARSRQHSERSIGGNREEANHRKRHPEPEEEVGRDLQRRKVSATQYVGNVKAVAEHYNSRPEVGVQHREFSPIIGLKKFNNWIKSVLIGKFAWRPPGKGARVLDIGCGKGGDLNKWKQARIRFYLGLDLADTSVEQAEGRYRTMNRPGFEAHFFAHDCFAKSINTVVPEALTSEPFDNVTMQFCMHYAFESASKARMMIENVSRNLRPGGVFIGTIPDSDLLLERLNAIPDDEEDLRFGNNCYYVEFTERRHKGIYGHQYQFYLEDAVEGVPEYLVNWENFESLALEYKMRLIYKKSFNEVLQEEQGSRDFGPLLGRMGVVDQNGQSAMDADQWEAANLYMAFAFEKL
ncbi:mRNA (guanine-N7-)-methyltransferase, partial [Tremellales sp. Uapishka_1]